MSLETNVSGHSHLRAQSCLVINVCGHKRVWAQACLGTNVFGHKRVWAQTCLGTIVRAQTCGLRKNVRVFQRQTISRCAFFDFTVN